MRAPALASNEAERLVALRAYAILDTEDEYPFDALTELAAGLLGAPIALVSLIDAHRQWFKSHHGLDASETPREVSFCGHVVAQGASLVVTDTLADIRFADNPFVMGEPHVRFYAGMPLRTPEGFVLGTLCVIDTVPRQPTEKELRLLALLADQVVDQLEARRKRQQLVVERAQALAEARRTEILFEAMTEGVIVFTRDGAVFDANSAAARMLGVPASELIGRSFADGTWRCVREDGNPLPLDEHPPAPTLRTSRPSLNTIVGVNQPNGEFCWLSVNALPLFNADRDRAVLATLHDITAAQWTRAATARRSQPTLRAPTDLVASERARARVLIVDEDRTLLDSMRRNLEPEHDVTAVVDARDALARIEAGATFDIVFCDLMLPGMGGDALYEAVRRHDPALAERFVFITGDVTERRIQPFLASLPTRRHQ